MAMVCLTDFEEYAKEHLSKATWDYYAAGADECCTRDDNLLAYKRYSGKIKFKQTFKVITIMRFKCFSGALIQEFLFLLFTDHMENKQYLQ